MKKKIGLLAAVSFLLLMPACSSAPKNPGDIYDLRKTAEAQLDLGNKQADRGSLDNALTLLKDTMRLAVITDDPSLRIRAALSLSNVLFLQGQQEEAEKGWDEALAEAEQIGNKELAAISRIHIARGKLLSPGGQNAAQSVRDGVNKDLSLIKSDPYYAAFAWTVIGQAEKELGRYPAAETAVKNSLGIHEKNRYIELAAYDWFLIASFRSLAGDYNGAIKALETAVSFDRRVENSWGLACDWRALGDVYKKAGNREAARNAFLRAAGIFRALRNNDAADETLARME